MSEIMTLQIKDYSKYLPNETSIYLISVIFYVDIYILLPNHIDICLI